eukprot:symbB.v1.2.029568.t1/scaffold3250.1/size60194/1
MAKIEVPTNHSPGLRPLSLAAQLLSNEVLCYAVLSVFPVREARRRSCLPGHVESALLLLGRGTCFARRGRDATG